MMDERYLRNLGALREEECKKLSEKKVFVAGCGGLGGHLIDMLLRIGVGEITAADGDIFETSNLNRQLLSNVENLGKNKALVAAEHAAIVNPSVHFYAVPEFITEKNASALIAGADAVLDGLDNIPSRRILKRTCDRQHIPYIHGAISGWEAQAAISMPGDGLMDLLYPEGVQSGSKSSLSFTPAICAGMQVSLCVRLLCGREVEAGKLWYFDLRDLELEKIF